MQNSATCCHPLRCAVSNDTAATVRILVNKSSIHDVGDSFKATVWMPVSTTWFIGAVINFTHLIHHDERVENIFCDAGKCTTNREAFTLKTTWCGGY